MVNLSVLKYREIARRGQETGGRDQRQGRGGDGQGPGPEPRDQLDREGVRRRGDHEAGRGVAALEVEGISTGAISLDLALGGHGLPKGRIIELFGPESSGKTTIALHAVANAQKNGGVAAFIDAEHALDPSWCKRLGVDIESLLVSQPSSAEEALQIAEMLVHSDAVDIIVVDSVAALVPGPRSRGRSATATSASRPA